MNDQDYYAIVEVQLEALPEVLVVPQGAHGLGVVVRSRGLPVGFLLIGASSGTHLDARRAVHEGIASGAVGWQLAEGIPVPQGGGPDVEIAICTRNRPQHLSRLLENLSAQAWVRKEEKGAPLVRGITVVDNAPPDDRAYQVVRKFPSVTYVREPKQGLNFARNRAVEVAEAEFVAFIDDDAIPDKAWYYGLGLAWSECKDAAGYTGVILPYRLSAPAQVLFEGAGGMSRHFRRICAKASELTRSLAVLQYLGAGANMVIRRSVWRELGGFDPALDSPSIPGGGDHDFIYRALRKGYPWVYEPRMAVYHEHRLDERSLRQQMYFWGLGYTALATKSIVLDGAMRWLWARQLAMYLMRRVAWIALATLGLRKFPWKPGLTVQELRGAVEGLCGAYWRACRSARQVLEHSLMSSVAH